MGSQVVSVRLWLLVRAETAEQGFTDLQRLGLAGGALGFFMLLDAILELRGLFGMSAVGIAFFAFMLRLMRRMQHQL